MEIINSKQYHHSAWLTLNAHMYWYRDHYDPEARKRVRDYFNAKVEIHFRIREYDVATDVFTGKRAVKINHDLLVYSKSTVDNIKFGDYLGNLGALYGMNEFGDFDEPILYSPSRLVRLSSNTLRHRMLASVNHDILNAFVYDIKLYGNNRRLFRKFLLAFGKTQPPLNENDEDIRSMLRQGYIYVEEDTEFIDLRSTDMQPCEHPLDLKTCESLRHPKVENLIEKYRADSCKENLDEIFNAIVCAMKKESYSGYVFNSIHNPKVYPKIPECYSTKEDYFANSDRMIVLYRWENKRLYYKMTSENPDDQQFLMVFTSYEKLVESQKVIGDYTKENWKPAAFIIYDIFDFIYYYNSKCAGIAINVGDSDVIIGREMIEAVCKNGHGGYIYDSRYC